MQGYNNKTGSLLCRNTTGLRSEVTTPQPDNRRPEGIITHFSRLCKKDLPVGAVCEALCHPMQDFLTKKARVFFIVAIAIGCTLFSFLQIATAICGINAKFT